MDFKINRYFPLSNPNLNQFLAYACKLFHYQWLLLMPLVGLKEATTHPAPAPAHSIRYSIWHSIKYHVQYIKRILQYPMLYMYVLYMYILYSMQYSLKRGGCGGSYLSCVLEQYTSWSRAWNQTTDQNHFVQNTQVLQTRHR